MLKFKMEIYKGDERVSIVSGRADKEDIDAALDYLLKLKEERFTNGQRTSIGNS